MFVRILAAVFLSSTCMMVLSDHPEWDSLNDPKGKGLVPSLPPESESAKYLKNDVVTRKEFLVVEAEHDDPYDGHSSHANGSNTSAVSTHREHSSIHVASWQWEYVRTPFIYTAVVIVAGLCKIGFHHAGYLSSIFPESCMLIMLGLVVGTIVHFTHSRDILPQFTPKAFFLFLLPPIVLESAYSLHDRAFFSNLGTIVLYAVLGTLINCFAIGLSLYGLAMVGAISGSFPMVECLVFSALISAVDPVAVLAIFQEVGVNKNLYFLVFGESLLNDAVTIVLYMMMVAFSQAEYITAEQVGLGIIAFICVSLGGLAIGVLMGVFTALVTKHTEDVRVVEPLAMLGIAYLSYLLAEMVHFSGIISIIGCGIVQAHYASKNISRKSNTTVKYFTKMVSAVCDTVIFLFLGMVLVDDQHQWNTGFILWTAGLCLLYRFIGVFLLTYCANRLERTRRIDAEEQFIMAYGGLRGAVAFSLVIMLNDIQNKQLFVTATLFIILFTVFVQGSTVKPLVRLLKIRGQAAKTQSMFTEVNQKLLDHVMAGVEEITGDHGGNYWKQLLSKYNSKYLKKWLQCNYKESSLTRVYTRMMLEDHFAHLYGPATVIEENRPLLLHKVSAGEQVDLLGGLPILDEGEEDEDDDEEEGVGVGGITMKTDREREEKQNDVHAEELPSDEREAERRPLRSRSQERPRSSSTSSGVRVPPLLQRETTLSLFKKSEEEDPSRLLHKALHDNPYNKLHMKFNPNLVGEEDQEMEAHLRLRRLRARRLTLLAMSSQQPKATADRRPSTASEDIANAPAVITAATFFLEKAQRRRSMRNKGLDSPQNKESSPPPCNNKSAKLERQTAISEATRDLSTELEKVIEMGSDKSLPVSAVARESPPSDAQRKCRSLSFETKV